MERPEPYRLAGCRNIRRRVWACLEQVFARQWCGHKSKPIPSARATAWARVRVASLTKMLLA